MGDGNDTNKSGKAGKAGTGRLGDRPYWVLASSIFIRAAHQVGAAVFLGSFLMENVITLPRLYLVIVSISGLVLVLTESMRHRQLLRELSGISTLIKLVILGLAYHGWIPAVPAVLFAFVVASICSHAPKSIRHRLIL